jgi:MFS transporter, FHS family, glucose/mannose:H+ symporter
MSRRVSRCPTGENMLDASSARKAFSGCLLSGLLTSFLGAILPAWGYHLGAEYLTVGSYFLSMHAGILVSMMLANWLLPNKGIRAGLASASALACVAFLYLALVPAAAPALWRTLGIFLLGISAGVLNTAVFQALTVVYRHNPASTVNLTGTFFGLGCLATALLVGGTFYVYTLPSILIFLALIPGFFAGIYARSRFESGAVPQQPSLRQALKDFKSPGAVLFSVLLFFQFGNEWAIAGWLTLFLTQRLGVSPESSLGLLALYWFALLVGRVSAQGLLPRVRHGRLLLTSGLLALLGCSILLFTNNLFGATVGILMIGGGFAAIYPLVVEKIGDRFPYYHPGFFNGIFSFAVTGGLLAPWTLGIFAHLWGIRVVMVLPMLGSCAVMLLLALIWIYAKLTGVPEVRTASK